MRSACDKALDCPDRSDTRDVRTDARDVRRLRRSGRGSPRGNICFKDWWTCRVLDERILLLDNQIGAGEGTRTPNPCLQDLVHGPPSVGLARHCAAASRPNSSTNAGWIPRVTTWDAVDQQRLGPPSPKPSQIFAVGVNYAAHSDETGIDVPAQPMIFTKFASSLTGPVGDLRLPTDTVDWEIELVAVIGRTASNVSAATAWDHVAGLTVGQGMSERTAQMAGTMPQSASPSHTPASPPLDHTWSRPTRCPTSTTSSCEPW